MDLLELVGEIRLVVRDQKSREPQMQVIRDVELQRLGHPWPFAALDSSGLVERGDLGHKLATDLLVGLALDNRRDDQMLAGLEAWAGALVDEVLSRARESKEVEVALADALVGGTRLIGAVERSRT
ncbi:MAG TPA: hypothetical protein VM142_03830 [Acidimicrobiales bacterium]|nr:hypothetical protein [Acidimicrobiales bacterium]